MERPLEGERALLPALLGHRIGELSREQFDDLGTRWMSPEMVVKRYPTAQGTHTAIDGALAAHHAHAGRWQAITDIVVDIPDYIAEFVWNPVELQRAPDSAYAAKFNLPFLVAYALKHGHVDLASFEDGGLQDPDVARLASMVRLVRSDEFPEFPASYPAAVRVRYVDGEEVHRVSGEPLDIDAAVAHKASTNLARRLGRDEADALISEWPRVCDGSLRWQPWLRRALWPSSCLP
jgi:2-methylcitrate dehydratase PrpD